ncbi:MULTISPECIES: hypothetical protein [Saccharopolyspora]|uniref:DUF4229 domain-containing protein n=1 Tax=Saccharopolyspora cebuensis TaxID=418759 RepID=A0ABV4CFN6_9PSEU
MDARQLTYLLVRTLVFLAVAVVVAALAGWPWYGVAAVGLTGAAAAVQLGGVLWLRRSERAKSSTMG